ncbi:MAG: HAMP domain-containing histidine kinase [Cyclobacteriaceae bacterium]|nr:HAMP domain-containing histidine kinase [Cyclobacteriaceae bacterium]
MKIRHRLSIFFGLAASLVLLAFGVSVYYFSAEYRKKEFNIRLMKRVEITERMFLERESFTVESYELIREQFLNTLPEETEDVVKIQTGWRDSLENNYPKEFLDQLVEAGVAYYSQGNRQGAGRIFKLTGGDFAVIIVGVDLVGINVLKNLRTILVAALIIGVAIMILTSYYMSNRVLSPISAKIQKANTISVKNLHERLRVFNPDDEIGQLALSFNRMLDRLDEAFHAQKLFVANASHEIRNPLTVIIGEADLALDRERPASAYQESLKIIQSEADRLNLLINNLLQLSTVSYTQGDLKLEIIALPILLMESRKKFDLLVPDNQVRFNFNVQKDLENITIHGSMNLLQTAIINIFDNASKFSNNDLVEVDVEYKDEQVTMSVKDRGLGIAPEDLPKITQPFFRAENVRKIRGTGIGIPLTVKIIELHRGKFEVESSLNKGTLVRITFPLMKV